MQIMAGSTSLLLIDNVHKWLITSAIEYLNSTYIIPAFLEQKDEMVSYDSFAHLHKRYFNLINTCCRKHIIQHK